MICTFIPQNVYMYVWGSARWNIRERSILKFLSGLIPEMIRGWIFMSAIWNDKTAISQITPKWFQTRKRLYTLSAYGFDDTTYKDQYNVTDYLDLTLSNKSSFYVNVKLNIMHKWT